MFTSFPPICAFFSSVSALTDGVLCPVVGLCVGHTRYPWGPRRPVFISKVGMLDAEGSPKYPDLDPDLGFFQCVSNPFFLFCLTSSPIHYLFAGCTKMWCDLFARARSGSLIVIVMAQIPMANAAWQPTRWAHAHCDPMLSRHRLYVESNADVAATLQARICPRP